jgi:hypothetical protein
MKMKTCLTVVLAMALLIGVMAPSAGAWCTVQGTCVGLSNYYDTNTWDLWTIVYLKPDVFTDNVTPGFLYYFTTKEAGLINLCNVATVSRHPVQISGNVESCPATGTYRNGGQIEQMKAW